MSTIEFALSFIAIVIPVAALWFEFSSRKRDEAKIIENRNLEEKRYRHEQRLQATQRLTDWAARVAQELSLADHVLHCSLQSASESELSLEKVRLAARLSSLVDEGRWLFPNHSPEAYGKEKARVNQGFRDNRLDALVATYKLLLGEKCIEPNGYRKQFAGKIQKLSIPLSEQVQQETT